jgi:hypothetical protein
VVDALEVAVLVARALETAGVPYFLGGSVASSLQGEPRSTNDIDFVIDLRANQIQGLVQALGTDFEVDQESLAEEVGRRGSWNIFFLPLAMKIDLFIKKLTPYDLAEFSRRRPFDLGDGKSLQVKSAEDTVVRKLLWFRQGGEVSTSQWRDIVQVLRMSGAGLDNAYLAEWATTLRLTDLLARARDEAARLS